LKAVALGEGACEGWLSWRRFAKWRDDLSVSRFIRRNGVPVSSFRLGKFMKFLPGLIVGAASQLAAGVAFAQYGNMMNGGASGMGWMGGYGIWGPLILVAVLVGVVVLVMKRREK
jgi:hypothetical protein